MNEDRILVVDDEPTIRHVLKSVVQNNGLVAEVAGSAEEGLAAVEAAPPAVAILDIVLPGKTGLELLAEIKVIAPETEVVMMTSHASLKTALEAIRNGAYDFLQKPFQDLHYVWSVMQRALDKQRLARRNIDLLQEKEQRNRELSLAVARLTSLVEAGRTMSEHGSLDDLFRYFIDFTCDNMGVDRASVMLLDEDTGKLAIKASHGLDHIDPQTVTVDLDHGIAGRVAKSGEPLLVTDTASDRRLEKLEPCDGGEDLANSFVSAPIVLSVPLRSSRKVLGVVNLTNRRDGSSFAQDDLNYLLALSGHFAATLDNLRRIEEAGRANQTLRATQNQLVASERLKVVGQVAAGVADEFNNLLSVILGKAELATMKLSAKEPKLDVVREHLQTISQTATHGAEVVRHIHRHTKSSAENASEAVELDAIVREAVDFIEARRAEGADPGDGDDMETVCELGSGAIVPGNAGELRQVIEILISNAVEAMPEGGRLTVTTRRHADRALLEVRDTGCGIDEASQGRVFEPFFSTKGDGRGLGTSILHEIVARHGGEVTFVSTPGEGSTFTVTLPHGGSPTVEDEAAALTRPLRILMVDDDETVCGTYAEALVESGYEVATAFSGGAALDLHDASPFDLIVTDLGMEGMSGLELASAVKERKASTPVVLISGWAGQYFSDKVVEAGVDRVLEKPCPMSVFLQTVEDTLCAHSAADGAPDGALNAVKIEGP